MTADEEPVRLLIRESVLRNIWIENIQTGEEWPVPCWVLYAVTGTAREEVCRMVDPPEEP